MILTSVLSTLLQHCVELSNKVLPIRACFLGVSTPSNQIHCVGFLELCKLQLTCHLNKGIFPVSSISNPPTQSHHFYINVFAFFGIFTILFSLKSFVSLFKVNFPIPLHQNLSSKRQRCCPSYSLLHLQCLTCCLVSVLSCR